MLVATQSFTAEDPYNGTVQIIAGLSRVHEDHELARLAPDRFKPAPDLLLVRRRRAASSRVPAPRRAPRSPSPLGVPGRWHPQPPAPPERRRVALSTGPGTVGVQIYGGALRELERLARRSDDGMEVGGILLGPRRFGTVEISESCHHGPGAVRAATSFTPDGAHDQELDGEASWRSDGYIAQRGCWHTHLDGNDSPSPGDLRAWSGKRLEFGLREYLGVIVTPQLRPTGGSRSFAYPRVSCWVVRADVLDLSDIAERALIV